MIIERKAFEPWILDAWVEQLVKIGGFKTIDISSGTYLCIDEDYKEIIGTNYSAFFTPVTTFDDLVKFLTQKKVLGYKAFKLVDNNLDCRGYKYCEGASHVFDDKIELCSRGFHFCKELPQVFKYYSKPGFNNDVVVHEVEAIGNTIQGDDKCVTDRIHIGRRISTSEINIWEYKHLLEIVAELEQVTNTRIYIGGSLALKHADCLEDRPIKDLDLTVKNLNRFRAAIEKNYPKTSGGERKSSFQGTIHRKFSTEFKGVNIDFFEDQSINDINYLKDNLFNYDYSFYDCGKIIDAKLSYILQDRTNSESAVKHTKDVQYYLRKNNLKITTVKNEVI